VNCSSQVGPIGQKGIIGIKGNRYFSRMNVTHRCKHAGETGDQGPQGNVGPQGPTGSDGPLGDLGLNGTIGDPGLPGAHGDQGIMGKNGKQQNLM
jgi:hypothetical protein